MSKVAMTFKTRIDHRIKYRKKNVKIEKPLVGLYFVTLACIDTKPID